MQHTSRCVAWLVHRRPWHHDTTCHGHGQVNRSQPRGEADDVQVRRDDGDGEGRVDGRQKDVAMAHGEGGTGERRLGGCRHGRARSRRMAEARVSDGARRLPGGTRLPQDVEAGGSRRKHVRRGRVVCDVRRHARQASRPSVAAGPEERWLVREDRTVRGRQEQRGISRRVWEEAAANARQSRSETVRCRAARAGTRHGETNPPTCLPTDRRDADRRRKHRPSAQSAIDGRKMRGRQGAVSPNQKTIHGRSVPAGNHPRHVAMHAAQTRPQVAARRFQRVLQAGAGLPRRTSKCQSAAWNHERSQGHTRTGGLGRLVVRQGHRHGICGRLEDR
mmetsp:Transcript_7540/g.26896  ORF Transcript_7540/g.26896 Transcript_7540/m.26896 type:complete len:333 (+) Transcript_7540:3-1001(+)